VAGVVKVYKQQLEYARGPGALKFSIQLKVVDAPSLNQMKAIAAIWNLVLL
jgi:hypothetical protein